MSQAFVIGLDMDSYPIRTRIEKLPEILVRLRNHQVRIEGQPGVWSDRRDKLGPE